jgi:NADH-quinone oxidoreductase subunit J
MYSFNDTVNNYVRPIEMINIYPILGKRMPYATFFQYMFVNGTTFATCILLFALLFCAMAVIYSKNPVHSILYLILVFFCSSCLLLLYGLEFLALIFMIVYVGAIAVLFLFVIMMLNIRVLELSDDFLKYLPLLAIVSLSFFFTISRNYSHFGFWDHEFLNCEVSEVAQPFYYLFNSFKKLPEYECFFYFRDLEEQAFLQAKTSGQLTERDWVKSFFELKELTLLSQLLYVNYVSLFWLAGLILLVAMLGAIVLTIHSNFAIKKQIIFKQLSREYKKTIKYLN